PSTMPNLTLVLLALTASSMAYSSGRAAQQLAGHDPARPRLGLQQERAPAVDAVEAPTHQLVAQLHVHIGANGPGLGEPVGSHRGETLSPPLGQAGGEGGRELLQGGLYGAPQGCTRIAHLGQLGGEAYVDANACHDMLHDPGLADGALEQDA